LQVLPSLVVIVFMVAPFVILCNNVCFVASPMSKSISYLALL